MRGETESAQGLSRCATCIGKIPNFLDYLADSVVNLLCLKAPWLGMLMLTVVGVRLI